MESMQKYIEDKVSGGEHGKHHIYWVPVNLFNELPIQKWKFNRPPDQERVDEIHQYILKEKRVDGLIYLACIKNKLVCYESNHRREALRGITDIDEILVDIIWNATDDMVKEEFRRLNKAVSVPDLFVSDDAHMDLDEILKIRNDFCAKFKDLKSPAKNPHRPSFNSDLLLDEFTKVMKENKIGTQELWDRLMRLNDDMSRRDRKKLTPKVIEKCQESGLWLFAWSKSLNSNELAFPVPA
jgi:hypothetical protein